MSSKTQVKTKGEVKIKNESALDRLRKMPTDQLVHMVDEHGNPRVITVGEVIAEIEQKAAAKQAMEKKAKPKAKAKK